MARSKTVPSKKSKKKHLIISNSPNSKVAEQYRSLRTNLQYLSKNNSNRSIIISSPGIGEGKTSTAVNLAISLVEQGKKVLVIDSDLSNPSIHLVFNIKNSLGLVNILLKEMNTDEVINHTEIARLDVITSGAPIEGINKQLDLNNLEIIVETALESYDYVLFDSPPILEKSITKILCNICQGVILVICQDKTERDHVIEAKRVLELAGAELIGVNLNKKT